MGLFCAFASSRLRVRPWSRAGWGPTSAGASDRGTLLGHRHRYVAVRPAALVAERAIGCPTEVIHSNTEDVLPGSAESGGGWRLAFPFVDPLGALAEGDGARTLVLLPRRVH